MALILIVEDETSLRSLFGKVLAGQGHRIASAASAAAALQLCREEQPELIVTDWLLEGGETGGELARLVQQECPHVKVIVITGQPGSSLFDDVDQPNVVSILAKPIELSELRTAVAGALKN